MLIVVLHSLLSLSMDCLTIFKLDWHPSLALRFLPGLHNLAFRFASVLMAVWLPLFATCSPDGAVSTTAITGLSSFGRTTSRTSRSSSCPWTRRFVVTQAICFMALASTPFNVFSSWASSWRPSRGRHARHGQLRAIWFLHRDPFADGHGPFVQLIALGAYLTSASRSWSSSQLGASSCCPMSRLNST